MWGILAACLIFFGKEGGNQKKQALPAHGQGFNFPTGF
jgi:hypothetical protein